MPSDFCTRQHHSVALRSFLSFEKVSEGSDGPITVISDSLQQFLLRCDGHIKHVICRRF
ncbi:hypothetical protein DPX39_010007900 [Trypanosoma brucei equiperdum]|uniref:Uncharacterized protein n=1 Tax=Trypanosoma brucei equiperdum TaxID=630700 RepID=A0A3L6LI83_9TRYP|nr:hypothetical protein DPX39_010007900 [Trypanosoma brucei equiperdum]